MYHCFCLIWTDHLNWKASMSFCRSLFFFLLWENKILDLGWHSLTYHKHVPRRKCHLGHCVIVTCSLWKVNTVSFALGIFDSSMASTEQRWVRAKLHAEENPVQVWWAVKVYPLTVKELMCTLERKRGEGGTCGKISCSCNFFCAGISKALQEKAESFKVLSFLKLPAGKRNAQS